jgi:hypothetical protein
MDQYSRAIRSGWGFVVTPVESGPVPVPEPALTTGADMNSLEERKNKIIARKYNFKWSLNVLQMFFTSFQFLINFEFSLTI